ncbi:cupin 2, conserved barrel domain-containing protein [Brachyspira pilosicoli]|uniref:cupin domain-containing protein n=1 Tax=Brachyspira pilosicoli TaxID=52584 RepID=UPI000E12CB41|nr:cupin domain-containing protein [Brachyspira pilosicoli]SUW08634.1 cupin 2, conserved barrel domain-containing protein [Brachyspira pilosicoli]
MYLNFDKTELKNWGNGLKRKILAYSDNLMTVYMEFDEGAIAETHSHDKHEQITYIIDGEFEFIINGEKYLCKTGDSMHFDKNISHGCKCIKKGKLLDTFTPKRQDFFNN